MQWQETKFFKMTIKVKKSFQFDIRNNKSQFSNSPRNTVTLSQQIYIFKYIGKNVYLHTPFWIFRALKWRLGSSLVSWWIDFNDFTWAEVHNLGLLTWDDARQTVYNLSDCKNYVTYRWCRTHKKALFVSVLTWQRKRKKRLDFKRNCCAAFTLTKS